jgi:hypothetical protein
MFSRPINDLVEISAAAAWMRPMTLQEKMCHLLLHTNQDTTSGGVPLWNSDTRSGETSQKPLRFF